MAHGKRNRQKLHRRQAREAHRDAVNADRPEQLERPPRTFFFAKARKDDTATLAFTFSGLSMPFDPEAENPAAGLAEKTAMVKHLASSSSRSIH